MNQFITGFYNFTLTTLITSADRIIFKMASVQRWKGKLHILLKDTKIEIVYNFFFKIVYFLKKKIKKPLNIWARHPYKPQDTFKRHTAD